jgi:hypothetical protein
MSDKLTIVTTFNTQLSSFMEAMINLLGGIYQTNKAEGIKTAHTKLSKYHLLLQTYFKVDFYGCVNQFLLHVIPHRHVIQSQDESFFMGNEISSYVNNSIANQLDKSDSSEVISAVMNLKEVWPFISAENKTVIFQYLEVLCYYTVEYAKIDHPELFA